MNEYTVHKSWPAEGKQIVQAVNDILSSMPMVRTYSCSRRDSRWYLFHHSMTFEQQVYLVHHMSIAGYRVRMRPDTFSVWPDEPPISISSMCDKCD